MNFNRVILAGNLTRDPQLSHTPGNTAVCEFGLAVNRKWRDKDGHNKEDTCFVGLVAYGRTAEVIRDHFTKGRPILVEGRLRYQQWTDKDGGKRNRLDVVVENFSFVDQRGESPQASAPTTPVSPLGAGIPEDPTTPF